MSSALPSFFALGLVALAALGLALGRDSPPERGAQRNAAARALAVALGLQTLHFLEEASTGFHERFPAVFGLPALPFPAFAAFNLAWIAAWIVSVPGLRARSAAAFFAAWFLAIGGTLNGVAHPLLALGERGYFPGLLSAPLVGVAAAWLGWRLLAATRPPDAGP